MGMADCGVSAISEPAEASAATAGMFNFRDPTREAVLTAEIAEETEIGVLIADDHLRIRIFF
jgi:hypothetical protein